jgi:phage terminase Nu1 subunit (DNA packaging protein)
MSDAIDHTGPLDPLQHQVSLATLENLLGKARGTIPGWIARKVNPCPVVRRADRKRGVTWLLDIADVVAWLEDRAAESAAARFAGKEIEGDAGESQEEAERLQAWTRYWREDLRLQADRGEVVRVDAVITAVAGEYANLRQALESLPNKLAVELSGMTSPEGIQELIADELRKALKSLRGRVTGGGRLDVEHAEEPDEPAVAENSDIAPEGLPPGGPVPPKAKRPKRRSAKGVVDVPA